MPAKHMRVLIANIPDMLSEILASELRLDAEVDVQISREGSELLASIGRVRPHVVIAAWRDMATPCEKRPLQMYLVGPDARSVRHIEVRSVGDDMDDVSLNQLVAAITSNKEP